MTGLPTSNDENTAHSIEVPSLLWQEWQAGRPRWAGNYQRLSGRITELIALDTWARHKHGIGILEHLVESDRMDWSDIDELTDEDATLASFPDTRRKVERADRD